MHLYDPLSAGSGSNDDAGSDLADALMEDMEKGAPYLQSFKHASLNPALQFNYQLLQISSVQNSFCHL